jgi:hypothetical protein
MSGSFLRTITIHIILAKRKRRGKGTLGQQMTKSAFNP